MNKGFMDVFNELNADIFCLQETKMQEGQLVLELDGYHQYWSYAEKKGYSGTAIFTKEKPFSVSYGLGIEELDTEGRLITLEFEDIYFITEYVPNAQDGLKRIDHRMKWEDAFRAYVSELQKKQLGKAVYEAVQRYFQDPEHVKKYEAWKKEKEAESDGGDKA